MFHNLTFTSTYFFLFAVIVLILYFIVPKYNWVILLLASILFYSTWGINKLSFILIASLISYIAAKLISDRYDKCEKKIASIQNDYTKEEIQKLRISTKKVSKCILIISVLLELLMLFYVKLGKLFIEAFSVKNLSIIVPLGISYYTFSLIGYVADCYWKKEKSESNYLKVLLFAVYFPKILQGPISKHRFLAPQLVEKHSFDYKNLTYGLQLILLGLFKKLVIADRLALFVGQVYGNYQNSSGSILLIATIFGAFQLYCDFSGCMDMAIGFSEIIGIKLEKNFNHPFFSQNAAEFWRRWHITLGIWFKDYVYIPISVSPFMMKLMGIVKKRFGITVAKNISIIICLSVVWILTGFWHGTGLNYIIWGIYWGSLIILSVLFEPFFLRINKILNINTETRIWHFVKIVRTFVLFLISRVFTIPSNIHISKTIFERIFFDFKMRELFDGTILLQGFGIRSIALISLCLIILFLISLIEEQGVDIRDWLATRHIVFRWILIYGLIFSIILFGMYNVGYDSSQFVYMKY